MKPRFISKYLFLSHSNFFPKWLTLYFILYLFFFLFLDLDLEKSSKNPMERSLPTKILVQVITFSNQWDLPGKHLLARWHWENWTSESSFFSVKQLTKLQEAIIVSNCTKHLIYFGCIHFAYYQISYRRRSSSVVHFIVLLKAE